MISNNIIVLLVATYTSASIKTFFACDAFHHVHHNAMMIIKSAPGNSCKNNNRNGLLDWPKKQQEKISYSSCFSSSTVDNHPSFLLSSSSLRMSSSSMEEEEEEEENNDLLWNYGSRIISSSLQKVKYVRIRPRTTRGSRRLFELQTAVVLFERIEPQKEQEQITDSSNKKMTKTTIELHAQLHFGDEAYYNYYNDPTMFSNNYDRVHYELVVSENLLQTDSNDTTTTNNNNNQWKRRRLLPTADGKNPIMAAPSDTQTAQQYGLYCQADVIQYTQPNWVHADYSREEFINAANPTKQQQQQQQQQPLWALASTSPLFPGVEFISALFRPSTPSTPLTARVTRRLFSNLFLPGDTLTALFRAALWTGLPAPELSVLLLDWSSLTPRPTGGISPIALPVLESLITGNLQEARKLVFSQMLVSGQAAENGGTNNFIIGQRNQRALQVVTNSIEQDKCQKNALIYGGMHCQDLHAKLQSMGFVAKKTQWRTAWSVNVPNFGTGINERTSTPTNNVMAQFAQTSSPAGIAAGLILLPLYLAVGAFDWVDTVQTVTGSLQNGESIDAFLVYFFYLLRHVTLYLGLGKFVVEWDGRSIFRVNDNK